MDKKIPAHEAAKAVLKKAEEMLKSSKLNDTHRTSEQGAIVRNAKAHQMATGNLSQESMDTAKGMTQNRRLKEMNAPKPNLTKQEDSADMAMSEHDQTPADGVQQEAAPEHDQVERNGNPPWGTEPGHYKLARFMGHRDARKKQKSQSEPLAKGDALATPKNAVSAAGHINSANRAFKHAKNPNASSPKIEREMGKESMGHAKALHEQKLDTIKNQPKPNLTKGEGEE